MQTSLQVLDRVEVVFDDDNAVGNGGLDLPMSLAGRLGVRELVDELVDLGDAPGRANVELKTMGLIASVLAGGDSIDDADVLRSGRSQTANVRLDGVRVHSGHRRSVSVSGHLRDDPDQILQ